MIEDRDEFFLRLCIFLRDGEGDKFDAAILADRRSVLEAAAEAALSYKLGMENAQDGIARAIRALGDKL